MVEEHSHSEESDPALLMRKNTKTLKKISGKGAGAEQHQNNGSRNKNILLSNVDTQKQTFGNDMFP